MANGEGGCSLTTKAASILPTPAKLKWIYLAVNVIDASALESREAIVGRLEAPGVTFHLSEVKGLVMEA